MGKVAQAFSQLSACRIAGFQSADGFALQNPAVCSLKALLRFLEPNFFHPFIPELAQHITAVSQITAVGAEDFERNRAIVITILE